LAEGSGLPQDCAADFHGALAGVPTWHFEASSAQAQLTEHFGTDNLAGFDVQDMPAAICAAGALLRYVSRTQSESLAHIQQLRTDRASQYVLMDPATRRNLELTETLRGEESPTLFSTLDHCATPMGSRFLRHWLHLPLRENAPAFARQQSIAALLEGYLGRVRDALAPLPDIERMAARVALRSVRPRELASLRDAMAALPEVQASLHTGASPDESTATPDFAGQHVGAQHLQALARCLALDPALAALLARAIAAEPALAIRDGGVIAEGYDAELDELRQLQTHSGDFLVQLEARERERTGIANLRVEFNRVHGFYIEVTKGQVERVPDDYRRRQTLKNAERYITPELKTWEDKILSAQERALARERWLFEQLLDQLAPHVQALSAAAAALAELDALAALALHARDLGWVAPH